MSDGIYDKIRGAIGKFADAGAHLNAASAAEKIGKSLGLSEDMIQFTHIELRNSVFEPGFKKIPFKDRALFLPHCTRKLPGCKATFDEDGYHCKHCKCCGLDEAVSMAEKLGYKQIYIVPGGSLVKKIIQKYKPKAAVGVCCFAEALISFEATKDTGVVPQLVLLLKDGCKDTLIDLTLLEKKLSLK
jgi:hypothetical protein